MIFSLSTLSAVEKQKSLERVTQIFFETSTRKNFSSEEEKEIFFEKWAGLYIKKWPELVFLIEGEPAVGKGPSCYLLGCKDSREAKAFIGPINPAYMLFEDLFEEYPAHLHINCAPQSQGQGLGQKLVKHYLEYLSQNNILGVHLVTSPKAQNVRFYEKCGFNFIVDREWQGALLRLMGQKINRYN